jgi:hypothetical protein
LIVFGVFSSTGFLFGTEDDDEDDRLEATNPKRAKHDEPPNVEEDNEMEVENLVGENELDLLRAESVGGEIRVLQKELDIVAFHIKDISTLLGHPGAPKHTITSYLFRGTYLIILKCLDTEALRTLLETRFHRQRLAST